LTHAAVRRGHTALYVRAPRLESDHLSACKAGVAAWSKVAEHDPDLVDADALIVVTDETDDVTPAVLARLGGTLHLPGLAIGRRYGRHYGERNERSGRLWRH
jgi:hypothetical protein